MRKQNQSSHKASIAGLTKIKQRRKEKGWNLNDVRWLQSASEVLGVTESGELAPGVSYGTWKRFLGGKKPVNENAFKAYCQVLELDWQQIVENCGTHLTVSDRDWGEAIDVTTFFGRTDELNTLQNWIIRDRCSLVLLLGMGGIGKTALAIKTARLVQSKFDFVIWRSLRNVPPLLELLPELIQFVSQRKETNLPSSIESKINLLLKYLSRYRCLIILDNLESILERQEAESGNCYLKIEREYGQFIELLSQEKHQSCLLLTSREKPQAITVLEQTNSLIRCDRVKGLNLNSAKDILSIKGLFEGSENDWQQLVDRYGGNPLALKIVASTIQDFFEGKITEFLEVLQQGFFICDDIYLLLQQQFDRLNHLEKQIMYWLAINREPVLLTELQLDIVKTSSIEKLTQALNDLTNRSLIEAQNNKYTQQPVVMEYAIAELIEQIQIEITTGKIGLFNSHALIKSQSKEYIQETQKLLILQSLIDKLIEVYWSELEIKNRLTDILEQWKLHPQKGYLSGNIINIFRQLKLNLTGYNFSGLTVWQANLQNLNLHRVNFTNCDLSRSVFTEALGNIMAVAFSPQADIFVTANTDGKVRIWNKQTGKIQSILSGHTDSVRCVAFDRQGKVLVSGGIDRTIKLWNLTTGQCRQTLTGHHNWVHSLAFSFNDRILASGSSDGTIKLWDVTTGECLNTLFGHQGGIRSVVFSPISPTRCDRGEVLASGSSDGTIKLWDVTTGECLNTLFGHQGGIRSVVFSPISPTRKGEFLVSGSSDGTIKLWNVTTGKCLKTYTGHSEGVYAIAFSPNGKILASGSGDNTIRLWDTTTNNCFKILYGHTNQIVSLDFSADSKTLACASLDRMVKLWDLDTDRCLYTIQGCTDWAFPIAFASSHHNKSPMLAGVSNDYTVQLWNTETEQCEKVLKGHQDHIWSVAYNSDGTKIASCGAEPNIRLWCGDSGECQQILEGHTDWVRSLAFHPGDRCLDARSPHSRASLAPALTLKGTPSDKDTPSDNGDAGSHRILASSSADGTVRLWDITTGTASIINEPQVWSVAFNSRGNLLATASIQGELKIWNVSTQRCDRILMAKSGIGIYSVAFNPRPIDNRDIIATGNSDRLLRLWDVETGKCLQTLAGHQEFISGVAFSPDGKIIASCSCDGTVRLWNSQTGSSLQVLTRKEDKFCSVAFSPDGQIVAAGSQNQFITLWDVATGKFLKAIVPQRLYEGMNISGAKGLTTAQRETLKVLGAIVDAVPAFKQ